MLSSSAVSSAGLSTVGRFESRLGEATRSAGLASIRPERTIWA